jgi:hypothetical protein
MSGSRRSSAILSHRISAISSDADFELTLPPRSQDNNTTAVRRPPTLRISGGNPFRRLLSSPSAASNNAVRESQRDLQAEVAFMFSQHSDSSTNRYPANSNSPNNTRHWQHGDSGPMDSSSQVAIGNPPQQMAASFIDTVLSQQLAGDDQMLSDILFRHAPEGWRDPITEFCHSQVVQLQNSSPDLGQVHNNYKKYRAVVKGDSKESCVWQFMYRDYKINYDKSPLPRAYRVTIEICQNYDGRVRPHHVGDWNNYMKDTFAYIFEEALVVARQGTKSLTRSCKVIGYLHYQKVNALDMPAYGNRDKALSIRCHNGTLMPDRQMIGDIRLSFESAEYKRFAKDAIVRWAATHQPRTISNEQVAWDARLKTLRNRHFVDPVTGKMTPGEEIEEYSRNVDKEHTLYTLRGKNKIGKDEFEELFADLRPKYEALPETVRQNLGKGLDISLAIEGGTASGMYQGTQSGYGAYQEAQLHGGYGADQEAHLHGGYGADQEAQLHGEYGADQEAQLHGGYGAVAHPYAPPRQDVRRGRGSGEP